MVTYGDLMSLLLTFFVLLVSFSSIQESKFLQALGSLKGALGVLPKYESTVFRQYVLMPKLSRRERVRVSMMMKKLQQALKEMKLDKKVKLNIKKDGILIRIDAPVLFDLGKANLKPEVYPVLDKIAELTQGWPNEIRIEGHTDNLPIHTAEFPSNWELSAARAISVLRYFVSRGIPASRLAAVGYGEFHPLVPNTTPENRAKNRRVEIYIMYKENKVAEEFKPFKPEVLSDGGRTNGK
jgi:chemotaxis protein MotB